MKKEYFSVKKIAICGVLIALNIIFARFLSIQAWNFRIGFTFVTYVLAATLYGPWEAAVVAGLGDILGASLFPVTGGYFPGFTLTAVLEGIVFGLFLKKKITLPKTIISVAIHQFILGLCMNSFWISVLYGKGLMLLIPTRVTQACVLFVVEIVVITILDKVLLPQLRKLA